MSMMIYVGSVILFLVYYLCVGRQKSTDVKNVARWV